MSAPLLASADRTLQLALIRPPQPDPVPRRQCQAAIAAAQRLQPVTMPSAVQLTLDLRAPTAKRTGSGEQRPYWEHVDLADVGGELRARRAGVQAILSAERRADGLWVGYHDLMLGTSGSSGPTRPQSSRDDALVSAAYQLMKHCDAVLARNGSLPRADARAARQLVTWLGQIDLL